MVPPPNLSKKRILIVEDDALICRVIQQHLDNAGFEVFSARDAEEALQKTSSMDFLDLCISDFRLPGATGFQLVEKLVVRYPSMKVIFTSATPVVELARRAKIPDTATFLGKPFTPTDVLDLVRSVLNLELTA